MKLVSKSNDSGYVVLHGDLDGLASNPDAIEVVLASDGRPFPTYMEALVYCRVSCAMAWRVLPVRHADTLSALMPTESRTA